MVREALWLSLWTSLTSLLLSILLGTPLAYLLARHPFPGRSVLDTLLDVPIVLPPAVAGVGLLVTFGRQGVLGSYLAKLGIHIGFTPMAVVLAQTFVAMPLYLRAARSGFEAVDPTYEQVAATLGEPPWGIFRHVTVPLALPSLLAGAVLAWARALGEFGATIMFAGNFQGRTQTIPLAILQSMESNLDITLLLSCLLIALSFLALFLLKASTRSRSQGGRP
jgi:molybdate transport system permease protein